VPEESYIVTTSDVEARLKWHNSGPSGHTLRYRPWSIAVTIEFPTEEQAARFEKYLKSGSGRAFAKRHFAASGEQ
jgi:predicted GIY-YIG superfamily endonuclease